MLLVFSTKNSSVVCSILIKNYPSYNYIFTLYQNLSEYPY